MSPQEGFRDSDEVFADYLEIHQGDLLAIAGQADQLLESEPGLVQVVYVAGRPEPVITEGFVTPEIAWSRYASDGNLLSEEQAEEKAADLNAIEIWKTKNDISNLLTRASRMAFQYYHPDIDYDSLEQPPTLDYTHADRRSVKTQEGLDVSVMTLHNVGAYDKLSVYELQSTDGDTNTLLLMEIYGGKAVNVLQVVHPAMDQDFERWYATLGQQRITDLTDALTGKFEDEDELDAMLQKTLADNISTGSEASISAVLDEIRARAVAVKDMQQTIGQLGRDLNLPSNEELDEWRRKLG